MRKWRVCYAAYLRGNARSPTSITLKTNRRMRWGGHSGSSLRPFGCSCTVSSPSCAVSDTPWNSRSSQPDGQAHRRRKSAPAVRSGLPPGGEPPPGSCDILDGGPWRAPAGKPVRHAAGRRHGRIRPRRRPWPRLWRHGAAQPRPSVAHATGQRDHADAEPVANGNPEPVGDAVRCNTRSRTGTGLDSDGWSTPRLGRRITRDLFDNGWHPLDDAIRLDRGLRG